MIRRRGHGGLGVLGMALLILCSGALSSLAADGVAFTRNADRVALSDFVEVTATVAPPAPGNPFVDVDVAGSFGRDGEAQRTVDGFCDAGDGSVFRIRFMPERSGEYRYTVRFRQGQSTVEHQGVFHAVDEGRRGVLRVDPEYPEHFVWAGTGEHYFWNGTTTYYLMGWEEERAIREGIERLAGLGVNRLRVLVYGRNEDRPWGQPVRSTDAFRLYLNPWPAQRPHDVANPGFDLTRFNVDFWRKFERLLGHARERDVVVSVIFFIGGQVLPCPFAENSADERRFYRYGVARLAAYSNVTWDLGNEHDFHRAVPVWCDTLGPLVKQWDPYDHLTSAHNVIYRTVGTDWNDVQLIQRWDSGQNAFMLAERQKQAASGRAIPQVNEEYGYEDLWEGFPGQRAADTRRLAAWEVAMAGCYQTTGETANRGVGFPPDRGGGWVSGRGDDTMTMLEGYRHMVRFFTSFEWWKGLPHNELTEASSFCLAAPGQWYAVYAKSTELTGLVLDTGRYRVRRYCPRTGTWADLAPAAAPVWADQPPAGGDWAYLLQRDDALPSALVPAPLAVDVVSDQGGLRVLFSGAVAPLSPERFALTPAGTVESVASSGDRANGLLLQTAGLEVGRDYVLTVPMPQPAPGGPAMASLPFSMVDVTQALVALPFDTVVDGTTPNLGRTSAGAPQATLTPACPLHVSLPLAAPGSLGALDFGTAAGEYAVEFPPDSSALLSRLRSFTLCGWLNCRSAEVGPGGNRVATTESNGGDGFDLVFLADGRLQLSVNQWPDGLHTVSSAGRIPVDPQAAAGNWRFFAVTYDGTVTSANVRFYFGSRSAPAEADTVIDYPRGAVGEAPGALAIGHFNHLTRHGHGDRLFRGLIDDLRVFGSLSDGRGAFGLEAIRAVQMTPARAAAQKPE